ncbi:Fertility inhibition protein [invertebrate metagenome]|uniref:Fertility inhibition protein n=1 Tax=invertebrate metagenome TaxID=1711999 RepID=A0A2H9TBC1_9ZZZZ
MSWVKQKESTRQRKESAHQKALRKKADKLGLTPFTPSRAKERAKGLDAISLLSGRWPDVFDVSDPRPLVPGIYDQIVHQQVLPASEVKRALRCYTRRKEYLRAMVAGRECIDLRGHLQGTVSFFEQQQAMLQLEKKQRRKSARKKVQSDRG